MKEFILQKAKEHEGQIITWRRHFHAHPELSFKEEKTSAFIASLLGSMGYENIRIGTAGRPTGVIAELNTSSEGPTVALRADMDALPVQEETGLPFASENPGVMHACGHDAHMAILLGAAQILSEMKESLPGKVRLLFQPSEESGEITQGALPMIEDGALEDVDAIFGLHVWQPLESGRLGWMEGPLMASSDRWTLTIRGKGGHGAAPHLSIDPTAAAGHFISMVQTFVSRELDPLKTAVVSVGEMKAGNAFNIIPDSVYLQGTARTFEPAVRSAVEESLRRIASHSCEALRCTAEFAYHRNLPPTVNDPAMARLGACAAEEIFGAGNVGETPPTMVGEDFSYFLEKIPGAFFFLGIGNREKGYAYPHHHPKFQVDDGVLALGSAFEALTTYTFLFQKKE